MNFGRVLFCSFPLEDVCAKSCLRVPWVGTKGNTLSQVWDIGQFAGPTGQRKLAQEMRREQNRTGETVLKGGGKENGVSFARADFSVTVGLVAGVYQGAIS